MKKSISLGFTLLLLGPCLAKENESKISSVFQLTAQNGGDEGFQPSTDFARILSVGYKDAIHNGSEPATEQGGFGTVRKFDSGNSPRFPSDETLPSIFQIFATPQKPNITATVSVVNGYANQHKMAMDKITKDARIRYGAASSHLHPLFRHYSEDANAQTGYYPPLALNEILNPHYVSQAAMRHQDSPHYHVHHSEHPQHSPNHIEGHHEHLQTNYQLSHNSDDNGLKEAVSKSLKFWIPAALLLTGASVLFPQKVKVPTNPSDILNRPKRSTHHYDFTAGGGDPEAERFERILPVVLGRESRRQLQNGGNSQTQNGKPETHARMLTSSSSVVRRIVQRPMGTGRNRGSSESSAETNVKSQDESLDSAESQESKVIAFSKEITQGHSAESREKSIITDSSVTPTDLTPSRERRKGRKLRVLLRATKNDTTPEKTDGVQAIPSAKLKSDIKPTHYQKTSSAAQSFKDSASAKNGSPNITTPNSSTAVTFKPTIQTTTVRSVDSKSSASTTSTLSQREPKLLQILSDNITPPTTPRSGFVPSSSSNDLLKQFDLSPDGPVVGLLTSVVDHRNESDVCQKRALCELAIRGSNPNATRFETFMWTLATLVPEAFTTFYDLEDTFAAIRDRQCLLFDCSNPNLDIQEIPTLQG